MDGKEDPRVLHAGVAWCGCRKDLHALWTSWDIEHAWLHPHTQVDQAILRYSKPLFYNRLLSMGKPMVWGTHILGPICFELAGRAPTLGVKYG